MNEKESGQNVQALTLINWKKCLFCQDNSEN